ncbi:hypothetical protein K488DRAFT_82949 [Vararia minispora EC-137]|uniref:Uncharacterized protein n=1 Tax=Vararia minispora EC-137 TaxID=1314806 RepID=A0ACB8QVN6_9AGAM|nr:hypothetical protein K488DRAFT_82949 [Vararia minispora EC-137]
MTSSPTLIAADGDQPPRLAHLDDYERYGRQMIIEPFGLQGQLRLQNASVLVVGAGGLGCPALQYLAAAGVGKITIVDHDTVDLSNLQRQILHTEARIGTNKAESATIALRQLNSLITVTPYPHALTSANAPALLAAHDIALDCTDNAPTRYLLSDTAARARIPLVSGAAQQLAGHIAVLALGTDGPCYRCVFPRPPPPALQSSCAETGILGAVVGVIGALQALEAVKILSGIADAAEQPRMLFYDALAAPPFRSVKLRPRRKDCAACGEPGARAMLDKDYIRFCGGPRPDWLRLGMLADAGTDRLCAAEVRECIGQLGACVLDVRPRAEFGICRLPSSTHAPLDAVVADPHAHVPVGATDVLVVCRLGNDSQVAADAIRAARIDGVRVRDLVGGLRAWAREVDPEFPVY